MASRTQSSLNSVRLKQTKILSKQLKIMLFTKNNDVYKATLISGAQNNILGICFANSDSEKIEVLEWTVGKNEPTRTSKEVVLKQVLSGLDSVNKSLNTNYKVSKIYFLPSDRTSNSVYKFLISQLIRHYHDGKEFKET